MNISFAAYGQQHKSYGQRYKGSLLEPYRKRRRIWDVVLETIQKASEVGADYDTLLREAKKAFPRGFSERELESSLSVLQTRKLIAYQKRTKRYSVVSGAPLPLR